MRKSGKSRRGALIYHEAAGSADDVSLCRAQAALAAHVALQSFPVRVGEDPAVVARTALEQGNELLVAFGGDGTVSAVAGALVGQEHAALGIIPAGTANSIAACLALPTDLDEACAVIAHGYRRAIDTARVNDRTFVLLTTIGVHADSVAGVDPQLKQQLGPLAYAIEEVTRFFSDEPFRVTLHANGRTWSGEASGVTVANLAPKINLLAQGTERVDAADGALDVTVVTLSGVADAVGTAAHLAMQVLMERPASRANIIGFRTQKVRIETAEPRQVMVDGDYIGTTPIEVVMQAQSLQVVVPDRGAEYLV